ncbi:MAG: hypothetical protein ABI823_08880, partial [Bryobacteraceae bacterium]
DALGNPNQASLGDRKRALEMYDKALRSLEPVLAADPESRLARRLHAQIRVQRAGTRDFGGKSGEGLETLTRAVADLRRLAREDAGDVKTTLALAAGLQLLGKRVSAGGGVTEINRSDEVKEHYREAETVLRTALRAHPADPDLILHLAQIEYGRAIVFGSSEPDRAIQHHEAAVKWLAQLPVTSAETLEVRRLRANILLNLGWAQGQAHLYRAAISNMTLAAKVLENWAEMDPRNTTAQYQLSSAYRGRGIVHGYNHDRKEAIADFLAAAAIHKQLSAKDPANKVYRYLRGELLARVGNLLQESGKPTEARSAAAEGIQILTGLAAASGASLSHLFGACRWLTETSVTSLRNPSAASAFCQQAITRTKGEDPDGWQGLSLAREQLGDLAAATEAAKRALALLPPSAPGKPVSVQRQEMEHTLARLQSRSAAKE